MVWCVGCGWRCSGRVRWGTDEGPPLGRVEGRSRDGVDEGDGDERGKFGGVGDENMGFMFAKSSMAPPVALVKRFGGGDVDGGRWMGDIGSLTAAGALGRLMSLPGTRFSPVSCLVSVFFSRPVK